MADSGTTFAGKTLLDQNKVTRFGGQFSTEVMVNKKLYLLNEVEITADQAVAISTVLNITGPGRQVIITDVNNLENAKFYLLSDEPSEAAKARIDLEMVALGNEKIFDTSAASDEANA